MLNDIHILKASYPDLPEILALQKLAFISEAELYNDFTIEPLHQSLDSIQDDFNIYEFLVAKHQDKIVGSVKARETGEFCWIGRLIVNPEFQNRGIGKKLMHEIQHLFSATQRYVLCTGAGSIKNICLYKSIGFKISEEITDDKNPNVKMVKMIKENKR